MSLRKCGVELFCEGCQYVRGDQDGGFEITVPVAVGEGGPTGTARLHCVVSGERHRVELIELLGAESRAVHPSPGELEQMSAVLDFVGRHRVCGNQRICPPDVVRVVKAQDQGSAPPVRSAGQGTCD